MFNFVAERTAKGRIYPVGAQWQARPYTPAWREFGQHWPYTEPLRLEEYCRTHGVPLHIHGPNDPVPDNTWLPIGLGFFDFDIDYLSLLSDQARQRVQQGHYRLLFLYHEGDNPYRIKQRLDNLCQRHDLSVDCYNFVSSNSSADLIPGFHCLVDFELWYWQRNHAHAATTVSDHARSHDFLALCRLHRPWRAAIMADLLDLGVLDRAVWSYCDTASMDDQIDNPIEIDCLPGWRQRVSDFLQAAPRFADTLSDQERNDPSHLVLEFYQQSYCNLVLESQFDVDQSGGCFLTEKTFKAIKHGQLFFIAGAAGSLAQLRAMGYRTFDQHLDTQYDTIQDATQRWLALRASILDAQARGLHEIYQACRADLVHNQTLFCTAKTQRLNILCQRLNSNDNKQLY